MPQEGDEDVDAEQHEGGADESLHRCVDRRRQPVGKHDGAHPEREDDNRVADGIEGGEGHRPTGALLRPGDVADGCQVVPIDAVAEAEAERRQQQPGVQGLRDHVGNLPPCGPA